MAHAHFEADLRLLWAITPADALASSGATISDLPAVLDRVRANYSTGEFFLAATPLPSGTYQAFLKAAVPDLLERVKPLLPNATLEGDSLSFRLEGIDARKAVEDVLTRLRPLFAVRA